MFRKPFRDRAHGLADLLQYDTLLEPGIMVGKAGELMAGFWYFGVDTESSTANEMNILAMRLNGILSMLGNGWMMHCDAIRFPALGYPGRGAFPDPVSLAIDRERRHTYDGEGGHYQTAYAIIFTWLSPSTISAKAQSWLYETTGEKQKKGILKTNVVDEFKKSINEIENGLKSVFVGLERMGLKEHVSQSSFGMHTWYEDALLSYFHTCVTGSYHPVRLPEVATCLDCVVASQDFIAGMAPKIGDQHIAVINISGFPESSHAGILDSLNYLPIPYRYSTRYIWMDTEESKKIIDKGRKKWRQKITTFKDQLLGTQTGPIDRHALEMMIDAESAMSDANTNAIKFGYYTAVVVLMNKDPDLLQRYADHVREQLTIQGFPARIETANAVEAWLGSLPGEGVANIRQPIIHTLNLAHFLPTTSIWAGPEKNQCPFYGEDNAPLMYAKGAGSTPFRVSLHVGDVGHTLILGPTGSGKSTLLNLLMAQHRRYHRAKVFGFDKGMSAFVSTVAMGGDHYDVGGDSSTLAFCPLQHVDRPSERAWAAGWVESILELNNVVVTPAHRVTINSALLSLAAAPTTDRTMAHFAAAIQDPDLREALSPYYGSGVSATLLDAEKDMLQMSNHIVFEMESLMNMSDKNVVPVLLYLFHRIESQLDGSPVLIVLDEAWLLLDHPTFQEKIREWLKVLRKANAAVVFATQSIEDVVQSKIAPVIFQSCPTKILLPNAEAKNELSRAAYEKLGLNSRQMDLIAMGKPKSDYYYVSPAGRRVFNLELGPVALAFVGRSGKDDIADAKQMMQQYGEEAWIPYWMAHCGAGSRVHLLEDN